MNRRALVSALVLSLTGGMALSLVGCEDADTRPIAASQPGQRTTASGLGIVDVTPGTGDAAKAGDQVTVHYTGKLKDGTTFDSSYDRNEPFKFVLGAGRVIAGWDEGVAGMKVGGKRKLIIPPNLGYGADGQGPIPGNATLYFDIELLGIAAQK